MVSPTPKENKDSLSAVINYIYHDLRIKRKESVYRTSKESGLRPDVISKIESLHGNSSFDSIRRYIESYNIRFPQSAYIGWYNAGQLIREQQLFS